MKDKIKTLIDLQTIDLQINKIDDQLTGLNNDLDSRKDQLEELRGNILRNEDRFTSLELQRQNLETLVADETTRVKDRQGKLMHVQTNREYQSLLKEIEDAKSANKQREDEIVRIMEEVESIKVNTSELQSQFSTTQQLLEEETRSSEEQTRKLSLNREEISIHRNIAVGNVDPKYLRKYELLREKRNGIAVVGVTKGVCRGCNMNIPPQLFNNLLKEKELLSCPSCNRMIFHDPESTDE